MPLSCSGWPPAARPRSLGIDVVYVARRRISPRSLVHAAAQVGLLGGLAAGRSTSISERSHRRLWLGFLIVAALLLVGAPVLTALPSRGR